MARQRLTRWECTRLTGMLRPKLEPVELSDWQTVWRVLLDVLTVILFWAFILWLLIMGGAQ